MEDNIDLFLTRDIMKPNLSTNTSKAALISPSLGSGNLRYVNISTINLICCNILLNYSVTDQNV